MNSISKFILLFIDGLGLGLENELNPLMSADMPFLKNILGGNCLVQKINYRSDNIICKGIDASLGIEGIPQSATGQTTLFTGQNAAKSLGYHLPAYPNDDLIKIINDFSIFKTLKNRGLSGCFANAYRAEYFAHYRHSFSVTTYCVLTSGFPFLYIEDLLAGKAVYWDITNEHLKSIYDQTIPLITAEQAGKNLAEISKNHHFTLFESFESDHIGHKKDKVKAVIFLEKLDLFLKNVVMNMTSDTTLILTSDHGNIEDLSSGAHNINPVPLLVIGKNSSFFTAAVSITDIVPLIITIFDR